MRTNWLPERTLKKYGLKIRANINGGKAVGRPTIEERCPFDVDRALKLYEAGFSDNEIANMLDVDFWAIKKWRMLNGLKGNKHRAKIVEEKPKPVQTLAEVAAEARKHGMSYGQYVDAKRRGVL
jgi:hypothetical protein